jgi:hypothetical protein
MGPEKARHQHLPKLGDWATTQRNDKQQAGRQAGRQATTTTRKIGAPSAHLLFRPRHRPKRLIEIKRIKNRVREQCGIPKDDRKPFLESEREPKNPALSMHKTSVW